MMRALAVVIGRTRGERAHRQELRPRPLPRIREQHPLHGRGRAQAAGRRAALTRGAQGAPLRGRTGTL